MRKLILSLIIVLAILNPAYARNLRNFRPITPGLPIQTQWQMRQAQWMQQQYIMQQRYIQNYQLLMQQRMQWWLITRQQQINMWLYWRAMMYGY